MTSVASSPRDRDVPLRPIAFPPVLRSAYRGLHAVSPALAVRFARRLFFTPPPARRRPDQSALLASGRRFERATPRGRVVGWSWGGGAPVLLVHGWGGQAGQMAPFVEPLVARGFRPIVIDAPAHGDSPGSISSGLHFAAAIESLAVEFGPFAGVVGHSFGCVGLTFALARGLAAASAAYLAPPAGFETFVERFGDGLGLDASGRLRLRALVERSLGITFDRFEPRRLAPHIATPLLVLHDRGDDEVAFTEGEELARSWRGASFEATEGLGHYRLLRERRVVERVVGFVALANQTVATANSAG